MCFQLKLEQEAVAESRIPFSTDFGSKDTVEVGRCGAAYIGKDQGSDQEEQ